MGKNRPSAHKNVQKKTKQVEGYQCAVCGHVTGKAAGHHLIPYSEDGAANLQNMITLCHDCHKEYHKGKLKIDIRRF